MNLGSSIRRRRGKGRAAQPAGASAPARGPAVLLTPRVLGSGLAVALVGLALGWGVATRVLFPAPDALTVTVGESGEVAVTFDLR